MIAGPLLLLILPLAMAGIVYILLRWTSVSALLAIGTALALGFAVVTLPLDQPVHFWGGRQIAMGETVTFFGRELVLEQEDRVAMAFLFFTSAGVFFLAARFAPHSLLFPMGLALLSLLSGALLIRPLIYAALLVEIAAALSVFALQVEGGAPTRGGLRYLTFTTLALPGLLVTHWLLERYALTPNETGLLSTAAMLLALSFALLLGVVPFHTWVSAVASDSAPLAGTFVLTIGNGVVWFLLLDFLETYPWLSSNPRFESVVFTAGLAMVIVGGGACGSTASSGVGDGVRCAGGYRCCGDRLGVKEQPGVDVGPYVALGASLWPGAHVGRRQWPAGAQWWRRRRRRAAWIGVASAVEHGGPGLWGAFGGWDAGQRGLCLALGALSCSGAIKPRFRAVASPGGSGRDGWRVAGTVLPSGARACA